MLIRCSRCQALFSLQDGIASQQAAFQVECGRCLLVFEAHPVPPIRRIATPPPAAATPPPLRLVPTPPPAAAEPSLAAERHANPHEMVGLLKPRRPVVYRRPASFHNPLTPGGTVALAALAVVLLIAAWVLYKPRLPREVVQKAERARAEMLYDDDGSLEDAADLLGAAARAAPLEASLEADRGFVLLLRGSARRDLADRLEPLARTDAKAAADRETNLRESTRLLQEGVAAAKAAFDEAPRELASLRAMALAAALMAGNPQHYLDLAPRKDDPLLIYARSVAALAGGRGGEQQEHALSALAVVRQAEPRFLRAQVDAAEVALDRQELQASRQGLLKVLEENPKHERARALLILATR